MDIRNVVVVGAGLMGNSLAQVFASDPELNVKLKTRELKPDRFKPIENNLDLMVGRGAITSDEKTAILGRISFITDDTDAYADADFIIECYPEVMETKQDLLKHIENFCRDDCILATNTSVMSPTEISEKCLHRERVVGAHFWNPGHLIPLVEVVKSNFTTEDVMQDTMALLTRVGKMPVYCKKDVPGFVANRLQHALWREAFYMVQEGIADPAAIDNACKYGPGLRWPVMGPMENSDLVGIQLSYNIHNYILKDLADNHEPSPLLKEMLDRGELGMKSGKGWQEWTQEQAVASGKGLQEYLIDYNKSRNIKP